MKRDPEYLAGLAGEYMREGHPYFMPPLMVFCIATLFGIHDSFHFMHHVLGTSINATFNLPRFMAAALPTVSMVFRWFSRNRTWTAPSPASGNDIRNATQAFEAALADFKGKYDCMLTQLATIDGSTAPALLRDLEWMHGACSSLCRMSVAASGLLTAKTDLLEILLEEMRDHHEKAGAGAIATAASGFATIIAIGETTAGAAGAAAAAGGAGAATAGAATAGAATAGAAGAAGAGAAGTGAVAAGTASAVAAGAGSAGTATAAGAAVEALATGAATASAVGGAALVAPVILGGLTIAAGVCAWNHYSQANNFRAESRRITDVGSTCHAAWSKIFIMRLCLEWFRLESGTNPAALHFSSPFMQAKWGKFIQRHQATLGSGGLQDHAQLLGIWLQSEVEDLRTLRGQLLWPPATAGE